MKPTAEDLSRDPVADLATCEAAQPPPWRCEESIVPGATHRFYTVTHGPDDDKREQFDVFESGRHEDCIFIAMARVALPVWIRRAAAAEAEVARLCTALQHIAELSAVADDGHYASDAAVTNLGNIAREALKE